MNFYRIGKDITTFLRRSKQLPYNMPSMQYASNVVAMYHRPLNLFFIRLPFIIPDIASGFYDVHRLDLINFGRMVRCFVQHPRQAMPYYQILPIALYYSAIIFSKCA